MCVAGVGIGAHKGQKSALDPLESGSFVCHLMRILGTELDSERAAGTLLIHEPFPHYEKLTTFQHFCV